MALLPKYIAIDLDNTLYEYKSCHQAGLSAVVNYLSSNFKIDKRESTALYEKARRNVKHRLGDTASSHSRLLYFKSMLELMNLPNLLELSNVFDQMYWGHYLREMKRAEGAMSLLEVARENAIPVIIMSDLTTQIQIRKIAQLDIFDYLTGLITSEEVGRDKPNSEFFEYAYQAFNLGSGHWWVIGDDEQKDKGMADLPMSAEFLKVGQDFEGRPTLSKIAETLRKLCRG